MGIRPVPLDVVPCQVGEATCNVAVTSDKLAVVARKSEEGSKFLDVRGRLPGLDLFDVGWIGGDSIPR